MNGTISKNCPTLNGTGQFCLRYHPIPWFQRVLWSFLGVCIGLAAPARKGVAAYQAASGQLAVGLIFWACLLIAAGLAGIIITVHHERVGPWPMLMLTGASMPATLLALMGVFEP